MMVCLIFLLIGVGVGNPLFFKPVRGVLQAKKWTEVDCTILWSRTRSSPKSSSPDRRDRSVSSSATLDVFYEYEFEGETYRSNRYAPVSLFMVGEPQRIASKLRKEEKVTCFVDPEKPLEAVLHRGFGLWLFLGLIPAFFLFVGGIGFLLVLLPEKENGQSEV